MGKISLDNVANKHINMVNRVAEKVSKNHSIAGNIPVSANGFPPQYSVATTAAASQLSAIDNSFNVNIKKLEKITGLEKIQKTYKLGSISTTFINPVTAVTTNPVKPVSFKQTIARFNMNPLLSFMRGEVAQNVPLKNDAIAVPKGFLGGNLNVIA